MGISIITSTQKTLDVIKNQISNLIGDKIEVTGYHLESLGDIKINDELVLFTSKTIYNKAIKFVDKEASILIARRSINYHEINDIFKIPENTDVLLVNDLKETTNETIVLLNTLGIDYINLHPYYPGIESYVKCRFAITAGEPQLVPPCAEKIIDIKTRTIDFTTLVEILIKFNLMDEKANVLSAKYVLDIINLIKKRELIMAEQKKESIQLETIINTVSDGIIAWNEKNEITVFNHVSETIFNVLKSELLMDLPIDIKRLIQNNGENHEELIKIGDKEFIYNKNKMEYRNRLIGEVLTLKEVTEILRLEEELRRKLVLSEYVARYTFEDIEGNSPSILSTKEKAIKIAKSNSPILIQGQSGTGKELFAQAIHNESRRNIGPFVAVNFAALPDTLLDSELFGYEEGAFTGAMKGGKKGLFEQAHGGTIFLDEIGDAPLNFQIRLLRVIQEKQVRRIGGAKIIPIDVRIISASNKDLKKLMQEGKFREDLYYRLCVLPINIPKLSERKEDIMQLAISFYNYYIQQSKIGAEIFFSDVVDAFENYSWPGNIRELRNIVEYLVNIKNDEIPSINDLPIELLNLDSANHVIHYKNIKEAILERVYSCNLNNISVGRRSLSEYFNIPENQIRGYIEDLKNKELLEVYKGRKGIQLTEQGKKAFHKK